MPTFGQRLRELRKAKGLSQRALGAMAGVNFTYISKIENEKLDFAQFPSEQLIRFVAAALDADVDELLLLARKIPEQIKQRVIERPDAFRKIASMDAVNRKILLNETHADLFNEKPGLLRSTVDRYQSALLYLSSPGTAILAARR